MQILNYYTGLRCRSFERDYFQEIISNDLCLLVSAKFKNDNRFSQSVSLVFEIIIDFKGIF